MARLILVFGLISWIDNTASQEHKLVESLRRRLMTDNYDYMEGSDSDQLTHAPFYSRPDPAALEEEPSAEVKAIDEPFPPDPMALPSPNQSLDPGLDANPIGKDEDILGWKEQDADNTVLALPPGAVRRTLPKEGVEGKDLLYYVDESKLGDAVGDLGTTDTTNPGDVTETPRYKVLQVSRRNGRRSNRGLRRFLQEERDGHISILNLGGGPFPEFRLPRDRRQYMADDDGSEYSSRNEISSNEDVDIRKRKKQKRKHRAFLSNIGHILYSREMITKPEPTEPPPVILQKNKSNLDQENKQWESNNIENNNIDDNKIY